MKKILFSILLFFTLYTHAQIITTDPKFPVAGQAVDIIFDASLSSGGLADYAGDDVYAHTGAITDKSTSSSDWKYAPTWGDNAPKYKLTALGNKKWKLTITPTIQGYYGVAAGETIKKLAFVFRNGDGSVQGKYNGQDIMVDVYASTLSVAFDMPTSQQFIDKGSSLYIKANSSAPANLSLLLNETVIASQSNAATIALGYQFQQAGNYWLIAQAAANGKTARDSIYVSVLKDQVQKTLPSGARAGINYVNDSTATFVLYAPRKQSVFLIGDFNGWTPQNDYMLNKDGEYWWITVSHLVKGKEYAFQYLVDGNLKIADPYTDKVLDPWNDSYITAATYPDLKPYPTGKTTGIVSVVQTGQTPYNWQKTDFQPVSRDKLIIYELLVRDFTAEHTFTSTMQKLDYLQSLGINAIELMPVNEFEGNSSWGYNPSFYFAVDKYYGTKDSYKAFVDECHKRGIAVIMDMVLNHSYGQSPLVQLYWDAAKNRPAQRSPWYNTSSPNPVYNWGYDFNHDLPQTQALVDSVCGYWMKEYKIDGFRFDFTKGFTNFPGDGWAYDKSRINTLTRMAKQIYARKSDAIVIFEHLTENKEEEILADDANVMLWGNMNNPYCEAVMGYTEDNKTDLGWAIYKNRGWVKSNLVPYMESHDEERMMYKAEMWGVDKSLDVGLKRGALSAAFYFTLPGAKMIWQFGELGYDFSINNCPDGSVSDNCRLSEKPIRWEYLDDPLRKELYDVYSKLITVKKKYNIFENVNAVSYSLKDAQKYIVWRTDTLSVVLLGNFDNDQATLTVPMPSVGKWYNVFTNQQVDILQTNYSVKLNRGEFMLIANKSLLPPTSEGDAPLRLVDNQLFYTGNENVKNITLYDVTGRMIAKNTNQKMISVAAIKSNMPYIVKVDTETRSIKQKLINK